MTVEGYWTCRSFHELCNAKGIDAPILNQLYGILYEGQSAENALGALMSRDLKHERF